MSDIDRVWRELRGTQVRLIILLFLGFAMWQINRCSIDDMQQRLTTSPKSASPDINPASGK